MKPIGPSFAAELSAAGLAGLPFSWNEDGSFLFTTEPNGMGTTPMTPEQVAAVMAVYEAHNPEVEYPETPDVPEVVSRFQGREAMHQTSYGEGSLFEAAEAALASLDTPAMYRRAWDDLQEFHRDSEMLNAIATALGLDSDDLDALFILAGTIKA